MTTNQILTVVGAIIGAAIIIYFVFIATPPASEPTPTATSKINITEVCEGALAYMTFANGAEAEVFVAECKEGKHPEVIEQYKEQIGLGDGATI